MQINISFAYEIRMKKEDFSLNAASRVPKFTQ